MMQHNVGTGELQQRQSRDRELLEAHQDFAEAVEPGMSHFYHPPSRLIAWDLPVLTLFLFARTNVWHVPAFGYGNIALSGIVARVKRHIRRPVHPRLRSWHHDRLQRLHEELQIGTVRACGHDPDRYPTALRGQAVLRS